MVLVVMVVTTRFVSSYIRPNPLLSTSRYLLDVGVALS